MATTGISRGASRGATLLLTLLLLQPLSWTYAPAAQSAPVTIATLSSEDRAGWFRAESPDALRIGFADEALPGPTADTPLLDSRGILWMGIGTWVLAWLGLTGLQAHRANSLTGNRALQDESSLMALGIMLLVGPMFAAISAFAGNLMLMPIVPEAAQDEAYRQAQVLIALGGMFLSLLITFGLSSISLPRAGVRVLSF